VNEEINSTRKQEQGEVSEQDTATTQSPEGGVSEQDTPRGEMHGAALVMEAKDWYKDKFRQVVKVLTVLVVLLAASLAANLVQGLTEAKPRYFAVTDNLQIKKMKPLDKPAISQSGLFNWATRTITETFSLDFVHWREKLMDVKPQFTKKAFGQLITSLKESGNLEMIKKENLVLSATVTRSPVVTAKGVVDGRMTWKLEFPISLSYEGSGGTVASQDLMCNIMIRRVPTVNHPRGIKIAQLILK